MPTIIPVSRSFDQSTLAKLIEVDALVQRYRSVFALFDWSPFDSRVHLPRPGRPGHPKSAYLKAFLVKVYEQKPSMPKLRAFLLEHPLLVLELGFRPVLDYEHPYGFVIGCTVPTVRWLNAHLHTLDPRLLADLLAQTVQALQQEIPGLGEVVAFDVTHIYACVQENNLRAYIKERYNPEQQPKGDPDCRLGVKRSTNQEQSDGSRHRREGVFVGLRLGYCQCHHPRLW
jgi:hypothetical protein